MHNLHLWQGQQPWGWLEQLCPSETENSHRENVVAVLELSAGTSQLIIIIHRFCWGLLQHQSDCSIGTVP